MKIPRIARWALLAAAAFLLACHSDINVPRTKHAPIDDKPAAAPAAPAAPAAKP